MDSLNTSVICRVSDWLTAGAQVYFVTVLQTWGASPRPPGSLFAFNLTTQQQVGSLSGGCIEEDLIIYLQNLDFPSQPKCHIKRYGESPEENRRYMLPCGGTMSLLIESMSGAEARHHFVEIALYLSKHQQILRTVNLSSSVYQLQLIEKQSPKTDLIPNHGINIDESSNCLRHRLHPAYRLLLIGAGDVTSYLADFAKPLGFQVTICEPRQAFLNRLESFHNRDNIVVALPDDLIRAEFSDEFTGIICLAHDPKVDDMALLEALSHSSAFYIGAMGSQKTSQNRKDRLRALGILEYQLSQLHAPIGIDIHSKTPEEIAISILSDLISARYRHKTLRSLNK